MAEYISNSLDKLYPEFKVLVEKWLSECKKQGIEIVIQETWRSLDAQKAYYAQGRMSVEEVNKLRIAAGMPPLNPSDPTATKIITEREETSFNYGLALRFNIANATSNKDKLFEKAGKIAESLGLVWGGSWTTLKIPSIIEMKNWEKVAEKIKEKAKEEEKKQETKTIESPSTVKRIMPPPPSVKVIPEKQVNLRKQTLVEKDNPTKFTLVGFDEQVVSKTKQTEGQYVSLETDYLIKGFITELTVAKESLTSVNYSYMDSFISIPQTTGINMATLRLVLPFSDAVDYINYIVSQAVTLTNREYNLWYVSDGLAFLPEIRSIMLSSNPFAGFITVSGSIYFIENNFQSWSHKNSASNEQLPKNDSVGRSITTKSFSSLVINVQLGTTKHYSTTGNYVVVYDMLPIKIEFSEQITLMDEEYAIKQAGKLKNITFKYGKTGDKTFTITMYIDQVTTSPLAGNRMLTATYSGFLYQYNSN